MSVPESLQNLVQSFTPETLQAFMRTKSRDFRRSVDDLSTYDNDQFIGFQQVGEIEFGEKQNWDRLIVVCAQTTKDLTARSCRLAQFDIARKILKDERSDAGLFAFSDKAGQFRFSLVYTVYEDKKLRFNHYRRFTFFVQPDAANKTFFQQIGKGIFDSIKSIQTAFSIESVSDSFYKEFKPRFEQLSASVKGLGENDADRAEDFALLLVIRTIFLGFIQKRGWLGGDPAFLQSFLREYMERGKKGSFYSRWLSPLFFEALNTAPGHDVGGDDSDFSPELRKKLRSAPYLNGGLFSEKKEYDDQGWTIPDQELFNFFEFLFQYNFTVEENTLYDEDLELNPEFLGIIFERLVNKADGAVYTPREEVDLMCRLALLKWLEKNNETGCQARDLYELFFREIGDGNSPEEDQRSGSFSERQAEELLRMLESVTVCDPAVGSGAFPVGMMHVLDEIQVRLCQKIHKMYERSPFERKQRIIQNTLYGVEVKEWAVWICQLRLWISLFIEAGDEHRNSKIPLLPSLDFKIRKGDSLVQMIGSRLFPVQGHAQISPAMKKRVGELKQAKIDYFQNHAKKNGFNMVRHMETALFRDILTDEIKQNEQQLRAASRSVTQGGLFGGEEKRGGDLTLTTEIQNRIRDLEDQRDNLCNDHPLIWNIEFAEIFSEKGGFDLVIGNPPYVRQEAIADPYGKIQAREYKGLLSEMVKQDFPDCFSKSEKINAKSDLYTYFYLRGLRLLNEGGIHTFICSNSWLDVGYGTWMQKFLLDNCHVEFIIDNHARRSFANADVNTIISVIHAPLPRKKTKEIGKKRIRFIAFKKPFEETVFTENLIVIDNSDSVTKTDGFRVYPLTHAELKEQGMEYDDASELSKKMRVGKYVGDKWGGKYLRAPDIFFTILEKGKGKLVKLGDVAEIRRGFTTGANEFFYLTKEQAETWGIEKEFLKPILKSPRECKGADTKLSKTLYYIFSCNASKSEIKGKKALEYIKWGEANRFDRRPSCSSRSKWWSIGEWDIPDVILPCGFGAVFRAFINSKEMLADKRLYLLYSNVKEIGTILNSSLTPLMLEIGSRVGLGDGLLDLTVYEFQSILVPNIHLKAKLDDRNILSVFEECGIDPTSETPIEEQEPNPLPDRKELDDIIFDALDLTEDERKDVYRAVCRLVWNRISKAKSV